MREDYIEHLLQERKENEKQQEPRHDLTEKEFIEIYNDLIKFFASKNLTYGCVVRISLAWADAIMREAQEIYQ